MTLLVRSRLALQEDVDPPLSAGRDCGANPQDSVRGSNSCTVNVCPTLSDLPGPRTERTQGDQ